MDRNQELAELQRTWTPPAELTGYGPREVRLSGAGIGAAVLAGLLILGGVAAAIGLNRISTRQSDERDLLSEQGKDVEASVTRLWRAASKDRRPMVAYQFEADGRIYRKSVSAPLSVWKKLTIGSPLAVRFLPASPARNHPRDWVESTMPLWAALLIGLVLVAIGAGLVVILRRQLALLREGRPAPAVVTKYSYAQHGKRNFHYDFPLLSGSLANGKSGPGRSLPAIGATVCVIYDRENPSRNAPYPLEMVKLANSGSSKK